MSNRSRITARTQSRTPNASNSSTTTSSRVRSTNARDRSSPYGSFARRSNSNNEENQSPSTISKHPKQTRRGINNQRNASESYLSSDELQQIIVPDQSDDNDGLLQDTFNSTTQGVNSQLTSAHTTTTNNLVQNLSLNDTATPNAMSTNLQVHDSDNNYFMNNEKVCKFFDVIANGFYRCKICQQVKPIFFKFRKHFTSSAYKNNFSIIFF